MVSQGVYWAVYGFNLDSTGEFEGLRSGSGSGLHVGAFHGLGFRGLWFTFEFGRGVGFWVGVERCFVLPVGCRSPRDSNPKLLDFRTESLF